ncbi:hypothetical protein C8R46DRAFT_1122573 [Mycena filopes]|nr:hypothetical protein C8R46DRAFT_1122573 [Mycena filopes]
MFNLRQVCKASAALVSVCVSALFVTSSRSSSALPSALSPSFDFVKDLVIPFGPVSLNNTRKSTEISLHDFVAFEAPQFVYVEHPQVLDPLDFSDLTTDSRRSPSSPASSRSQRPSSSNPQAAGNAVVLEIIKSVFLNTATRVQAVRWVLGEAMDKLDGALTSIIFRMAIDLVLGALVALFRFKRKAHHNIKSSVHAIAPAVQLAAYYSAVIPFCLLLDISHVDFILLDSVLNSLAAAYLLDSVYRKTAKQLGVLTCMVLRKAIDLLLGTFVSLLQFKRKAHMSSVRAIAPAVQLGVYYLAVIPFRLVLDIIHNHLSLFDSILDGLVAAYLLNTIYDYLALRISPPPPPPPPPGRKKKRWHRHP